MNARNLITAALVAGLTAFCFAEANQPLAEVSPLDQAPGGSEEVEVENEFFASWTRIESGERHRFDMEVGDGELIIGLDVAGTSPLLLSVYGADGSMIASDFALGGGVACGLQLNLKAQTITIQIANMTHLNNAYKLIVL